MAPQRRNQEKKEKEEPKIKWESSNAKKLLRKDILEGRVPLQARDEGGRSTMKLETIYKMRPEYAEYRYSKFSSRLSSLRKTITDWKNRASLDQEAFDNFKQNHPTTNPFSRRGGYIQWQGSDAQKLLKEDIEDGRHLSMSKVDLHSSRVEYYENFPLDVFRDKLNQEIRTAKCLHTLEVKGKDPRKKWQ